MRAVAYNIQETEKEALALANAKVHDLTLISNALNVSTVHFAHGKEVIIVSDRDVIDASILEKLCELGVKKIITRSKTLDHIDMEIAGKMNLHIANTPEGDNSTENIAKQTINNLNNWAMNICLGLSCHCSFDCEQKQKTLKKD